MKRIKGGITAPQGFKVAAVAAGIKYQDRRDLALIVTDRPVPAAGVFTSNKVKAAPVLLCMRHLQKGAAQAIVVNSGNANACNGPQGEQDAMEMATVTGQALGCRSEEVLVCSTGVIGWPLPMTAVRKGIQDAVLRLGLDTAEDAARAIMTTDSFPKQAAVELPLGGKTVRIGGMAKGAGMIRPDMATMLAFITTDAALTAPLLQQALASAVDRSFNCITVDGDMSTNDTTLILANGAAGNPEIRDTGVEYAAFQNALEQVCITLAKMIVRDGEGATKLVEIRVTGAPTAEDARQAGLAVANSMLVKTALFGCDPNWGRIMCALGYSGAQLDPARIAIWICGQQIVAEGRGTDADLSLLSALLKKSEISIQIDMGLGRAEATVWTCDLSYDYVKINAEYTT